MSNLHSKYGRYYNEETSTGDFFYVRKDKMLYPEYNKMIHPKKTNSVRWYYYHKNNTGELIRVTERMRKYREVEHMSYKQAQAFMPEFFI